MDWIVVMKKDIQENNCKKKKRRNKNSQKPKNETSLFRFKKKSKLYIIGNKKKAIN